MKICKKCKIDKSLSDYYKATSNKDGHKDICKLCSNIESKLYKREYYTISENRKRKNITDNLSRTIRKIKSPECKVNRKIYNEKYYKLNKDKIDIQKKEYRLRTRESRNIYLRSWKKYKLSTDINFKLADLLRSRLRSAIEGNFKAGSAVSDLGCTVDYLKDYLQNLFQEGMSWENHGDWHIDHKKPLASFNLEDREELLKACHYTNLQPLWAKDNLSKGSKLGGI